MVVRGMVIRQVRSALDGAQERAQARPGNRRWGGVPVLSQRGVYRQRCLGLRQSDKNSRVEASACVRGQNPA